MKYTISTTTFEKKKTTTGKTVINTNLKGINDEIIDKVNIWEDFTNFDAIVAGGSVEGDIVTNAKGYKTLYPPKNNLGAKPWGNKGNKSEDIKVAQERTQVMVKTAQDNKEESIKQAASMRDAVLIVTSMYKDLAEQDIKVKILMWRKWYLNNWEHNSPNVTSTGDKVPDFIEVDQDTQDLADSIPF